MNLCTCYPAPPDSPEIPVGMYDEAPSLVAKAQRMAIYSFFTATAQGLLWFSISRLQ